MLPRGVAGMVENEKGKFPPNIWTGLMGCESKAYNINIHEGGS